MRLEPLARIERVPLSGQPTPVEPLPRLREALQGPQLFVKRDDAITLGGGGSKIRKLEFELRSALDRGADTIVTTGGIQSNHARATAAAAARLGLRCHLVLNGEAPCEPRGNFRLAKMFGATFEYVATRAERSDAMRAAKNRLEQDGHRPHIVPLGASTAAGALGLARAVQELTTQMAAPDVILHATSSGGTQAGLVAGCLLAGAPTRVIGISADDPADTIRETVTDILQELLGASDVQVGRADLAAMIEVDDTFVGGGYGVATPDSIAAQQMLARLEALILDPTYTAKAMAALVSYVRRRRFDNDERILFWHTGGVPAVHL